MLEIDESAYKKRERESARLFLSPPTLFWSAAAGRSPHSTASDLLAEKEWEKRIDGASQNKGHIPEVIKRKKTKERKKKERERGRK